MSHIWTTSGRVCPVCDKSMHNAFCNSFCLSFLCAVWCASRRPIIRGVSLRGASTAAHMLVHQVYSERAFDSEQSRILRVELEF